MHRLTDRITHTMTNALTTELGLHLVPWIRSDDVCMSKTCYLGFIYSGPALGGAGSNWEQFRSVQVPSQLAPRSVELGAGPYWEQNSGPIG